MPVACTLTLEPLDTDPGGPRNLLPAAGLLANLVIRLENFPGSAMLRIPEAFLEVARLSRAGELPAGAFYAGGSMGVVDYVVNPNLVDRYNPELLARLESIRLGIRSGIVDVPRIEFVEAGDGSRRQPRS